MENDMNIETQIKSADNGVNVDALLGAREALEAAPAAAQFTWRAACDWKGGVHSQSTVESFFGLGEEQTHSKQFQIEADHPPHFAAGDNGATPVEIVLCALASCLTAGVASVAQYRGIQLEAVRVQVEGDMDIHGILGMDPDVRNGFNAIRVTFDIKSDGSREDIEAVVAQSQKRSAVFDIITNPTTVVVSVA
ncbi:MAG: OsmC family protein [Pseudomonadota bacterium]